MTIATQRSTLYRSLLLLGVTSLVACGGGGGGGNKPKTSSKAESSLSSSVASSALSSVASSIVASSSSSVAVVDTSPAVFNFAPTTDVALSTAITSPAITLSGFDVAVPVSIINGEYSINGGVFTSAAGTISPAQTLAVKVTSSNTNSTAVTTTLTVGGVSATYTVTTLADAIPDAFSFTPATNVEPESTSTSNAITVSGIEVATVISITGGEYSINGGAFTSAAGTVTNGQTVAVKAIAPAGTDLTQNAVVTIGGVSGTYAVTTVPDTTPPVAEFKFPTPYTMSEANSVKVRGTAIDDNAITSVKVIVSNNLNATVEEKEVTPKAEGDYSSWTVDVPLTALAENEIKVVATDDRGNAIEVEDADKVVIRQAPIASAFPDDLNEFERLPQSIALDKSGDRNRLLASDHERDVIYAVDLDAGIRTTFIEINNDDCTNHAEGIILDAANNKLYAFCNVQPKTKLLEYNLVSGELENTYATSSTAYVYAMALDRNNSRNQIVFATYTFSENVWEEDQGGVYAFDLEKKTFSTISEKTNQQIPIVEAAHIVVNGNQYLVNSGGVLEGPDTRKIIAVDALTGVRSVVSSNAIGSGELFRGILPGGFSIHLLGLYVEPENSRILVVEYGGKIFSVDLTTGDRSVFKDISYSPTDGEDSVYTQDIEVDAAENIAYIDDNNRKAILILDLETRERVILSKSENNF